VNGGEAGGDEFDFAEIYVLEDEMLSRDSVGEGVRGAGGPPIWNLRFGMMCGTRLMEASARGVIQCTMIKTDESQRYEGILQESED